MVVCGCSAENFGLPQDTLVALLNICPIWMKPCHSDFAFSKAVSLHTKPCSRWAFLQSGARVFRLHLKQAMVMSNKDDQSWLHVDVEKRQKIWQCNLLTWLFNSSYWTLHQHLWHILKQVAQLWWKRFSPLPHWCRFLSFIFLAWKSSTPPTFSHWFSDI